VLRKQAHHCYGDASPLQFIFQVAYFALHSTHILELLEKSQLTAKSEYKMQEALTIKKKTMLSLANAPHLSCFLGALQVQALLFGFIAINVNPHFITSNYIWKRFSRPPLWSSDYRTRRPGFDSQHYQNKKVVGLERGPLSLVSTTEELLDRKVVAPV
jgi:hypothetical protein